MRSLGLAGLLRRVTPAMADLRIERRLRRGAKDRWIGGDVAIPVDLGDNRRLWLFSDSWIGSGNRASGKMIHNSVAIESITTGVWDFLTTSGANDFLATDGPGWLWPMSAQRAGSKIYIACTRVEEDSADLFGTRRLGTEIFILDIDGHNPREWRQTHQKLSGFRGRETGDHYLGAAMSIHGEEMVLFGAREKMCDETGLRPEGREILVAKLPLADLSGEPRYLHSDGWRAKRTGAKALFDCAAPVLGLFKIGKKWVILYIHLGAGRRVVWRQARHLEGPWSAPRKLFNCWRPWFRRHHYCYGLQVVTYDRHRILICYSVNSLRGIAEHLRNRRLYWPLFVSAPVLPI